MTIRSALLLAAALSASLTVCPRSGAAQSPSFVFPLECTPGETCWILNYMDINRSPGKAEDYTCGSRTYDQYNGTAIAARDMKEKLKAVAVADGVVDVALDGKAEDKILQNACGAGLVLHHEGGWESRYCHLAPGSVTVKPGQRVRQGEALGQAGMSGGVSWPQIHFDLMRNGRFYDPVSGLADYEGCGVSSSPLLSPGPAYQPLAVFAAGFTAGSPTLEKVRDGLARLVEMPAATPALVLWATVFGTQKGDQVDMTVYDPQGVPFMNLNGTVSDSANPQLLTAVRERGADTWEKGLYKGVITVQRASGAAPLQEVRTTSIWLK